MVSYFVLLFAIIRRVFLRFAHPLRAANLQSSPSVGVQRLSLLLSAALIAIRGVAQLRLVKGTSLRVFLVSTAEGETSYLPALSRLFGGPKRRLAFSQASRQSNYVSQTPLVTRKLETGKTL